MIFFFVSWSERRNDLICLHDSEITKYCRHTGDKGIIGVQQINDTQYGLCLLTYSAHSVILWTDIMTSKWNIKWKIEFKNDLLFIHSAFALVLNNCFQTLFVGLEGGGVNIFHRSQIPVDRSEDFSALITKRSPSC